ncbi:hypothetical protein [Methylocucumis oryzae]|nr:hypothetical protein [Methylocucumis oryzae]
MRLMTTLLAAVALIASLAPVVTYADESVQLGPRPFFLIDDMAKKAR